MKRLLTVFSTLLLLVACNQPTTLVGTESLPDGTVVKHHHIYVAEGKTTTTDNKVGRYPTTDVTIQK